MGHPKTVCPTPKVESEMTDVGAVFLVQHVTETIAANSVIRYPCQKDMEKMEKFELIVIDSGASISVAPKEFYTKIPLDTKDKEHYKIQNASGKKFKNSWNTRGTFYV